MMHVIWYTGMSMDGRIASAGDDLAFLDTIGPDSENGEDFPRFIASCDSGTLSALNANIAPLVSSASGTLPLKWFHPHPPGAASE